MEEEEYIILESKFDINKKIQISKAIAC